MICSSFDIAVDHRAPFIGEKDVAQAGSGKMYLRPYLTPVPVHLGAMSGFA